MLYLFIVLSVAYVIIVIGTNYFWYSVLTEMQRVAREERQELVTRLQHPNLVPIPKTRAEEEKIKEGEVVDPFSEEEADELGKVGRINP